MGPSRRQKFYAVRVGRGGPAVYNNWKQGMDAVYRYSRAQLKGFLALQAATDWLKEGGVPFFADPTGSIEERAKSDAIWPKASELHTDEAKNALKSVACTNVALNSFEACLKTDILCKFDDEEDFKMVVDSTGPVESDVSTEETEVPTSLIDPEPDLSAEQEYVLERVLSGASVFFTGPAGTGKSVLLRTIISNLRARRKKTAITASTGLASLNIGGTTLHSFAGVGLGKEPAEALIKNMSDAAKHRWRKTRVLIIDEISMVDGKFFDKLEFIARVVRGNNQAFGGLQLVISGDFCQLPPVPDLHDGVQVPITFAFDSESWNRSINTSIILNKVFRQKEQTFVNLLNDLRYGTLSNEGTRQLASLSRTIVYSDGIEPTELFPLRREVESANAKRLLRLPGPVYAYVSSDTRGKDIRGNQVSWKVAERLLERLVAVKSVIFKLGAQVMLIKNRPDVVDDNRRLVNGSQGHVIDFKSIAEAQNSDVQLSINENEERRLEKLMRSLTRLSKQDRLWPVVRFTNGRTILCVPEIFTVVNVNGFVEASRLQVPLILAWAMSVHKSQGQTLERMEVDLKRTFEKGQAYVALSRAKSMDGLQILNLDPSRVMAHPRVLAWHAELVRELDVKEEKAIMQELSSEAALKSFFEDDEKF